MNRFVITGAGEKPSVRGKRQRFDAGVMTGQRRFPFPRPRVPKPDRFINAAAGEDRAIGRKCDRPDDIVVRRDRKEELR